MSDNNYDLSGILSRNERRERDSQPEFTCNAILDGISYFVDAWVNERRDGSGKKYFRLKFKRKDQQQAQANGAGGGAKKVPFVEDNIPFAPIA